MSTVQEWLHSGLTPKTGYVSAEDDAAVKDCRVCLLIFDSETNQPAPSLIDMSQALRTGGSD